MALAQIVLLGALVWAWSGDTESASGTIDWAYVALTLATPTLLAGSFLMARRIRQRTDPSTSRAGRVLGWAAHYTTLTILVPTAVFALPSTLIAIFIDPVG